MISHPVHLATAFVFGLLIGSFLNVVVYRLPRGVDILTRRSFCPQCKSGISWFHNLPLVSFLLLRGRCRDCRARIPWRYPLVELVSGLLLGFSIWRWGLTSSALVSTVFACAMLVLALIDIDFRILPNVITLPGIVIGVGFSLVDPRVSLADSLLGALLGGGVLYGLAWLYLKTRSREGMGMGDVKMMAMVGAFVGWRGAFVTLFVGSLLGSLVGLLMVLVRGKQWHYALPFGTFLALAAVITDAYGSELMAWYMGIFGPAP